MARREVLTKSYSSDEIISSNGRCLRDLYKYLEVREESEAVSVSPWRHTFWLTAVFSAFGIGAAITGYAVRSGLLTIVGA